MKLTPQTIAAATKSADLDGRRVELADDEVRGLVLRVSGEPDASGQEVSKEKRRGAWSVRFVQADGTRIRVPLGSYAEVSIAEARRAARAVKEKGRAGETVSASARREAAREIERQRTTLRTHLESYDRQRLAALRSGDLARRSIELLLGDRLDQEPNVLTRRVFASLIDARAKSAPVAANRSLAYVRPFLKWLVTRGHLEVDPARDFEKPTKEFPRERAPSLAEIEDIRRAAETLGYPFGHFFRTLLLTAGRRDEVAEMRIEELDLDCADGAVWTLPSARSKNGRAFRVPLSDEAVSLLKEAIDLRPVGVSACPYVFSTTGTTPISGWTRAKSALDRAITAARTQTAEAAGADVEPMPHWTLHDLRRGFATVAVDVLHLDPVVVDRCLNHIAAGTTSVVARVYQRSEMLDQRRSAMAAWGRLIGGSDRAAYGVADLTGRLRRKATLK